MSDFSIKNLVNNGELFLVDIKDQEELYSFLNKELTQKEAVRDTFLDALSKRELQFPTGIVSFPYNIALPHVDAEHVKTNSLNICILKNPIKYHRMDDNSEIIDVKVVFLLLIESLELHVKTISKLTEIWMNPDIMLSLLEVKTKEALVELISKIDI